MECAYSYRRQRTFWKRKTLRLCGDGAKNKRQNWRLSTKAPVTPTSLKGVSAEVVVVEEFVVYLDQTLDWEGQRQLNFF